MSGCSTDSINARLEVTLAGEIVHLLAARALWWPRGSVLFAADTHFGKSATFRRFGIPAPDETESDLARLSTLIQSRGARKLVILGDFFHSRQGRSESVLELLGQWRRSLPGLAITVVRGNHDRGAGDPPESWKVECVGDGWTCGPFVCCHVPCERSGSYVLCGHVHPGLALSEKNGARMHMACFVVGLQRTILPAFGTFTGLALQQPAPDEEIFALQGDAILKIKSRVLPLKSPTV